MKPFLSLVAICLSLFLASDVWAHQVHRVKKGETLYRIAKTHGVTVKDLKKANHLAGSLIKSGQKLRIPSRSNDSDKEQNKKEEGSGINEPEAMTGAVSEMEGAPQEDQVVSEEKAVVEDQGNIDIPETEATTDAMDEGETPLIAFAREYLGVPYRFGGENPKKGIDCSAFVQRVFQHFDIDLPRTAREQFKAGVRVSQGELEVGDLQIGDLIFFRTYARFPSHVGIYVGEGKMIHASSRYRKVSITQVDLPYYKKRFIGVVRIQNTSPIM